MTNKSKTETINSGESKWLEGSYFNGHLALFDLPPNKENTRYVMELYYANGTKDDAAYYWNRYIWLDSKLSSIFTTIAAE